MIWLHGLVNICVWSFIWANVKTRYDTLEKHSIKWEDLIMEAFLLSMKDIIVENVHIKYYKIMLIPHYLMGLATQDGHFTVFMNPLCLMLQLALSLTFNFNCGYGYISSFDWQFSFFKKCPSNFLATIWLVPSNFSVSFLTKN